MKFFQSISQSAFASPTLIKDEKGEGGRLEGAKSDLCTDYKKRIKIFHSTVKQLNFPDIPMTNKKTTRPIMILERVKVTSSACEHIPRLGIEKLERQKTDSVLPVISYKKTIHKSLKKLTTAQIITSSHRSPEKTSCYRYTSEKYFPNKDFYTFRNSIPISKVDNSANLEFSATNTEVYKSNPSILSYPLSPRVVKDIIEDEFHYTNVLKNSEFTSFFSLLECQFETYPNPFPYCGKILKTVPRRKFFVVKKNSTPSKYKDFPCNPVTIQDTSIYPQNKFIHQVPKISRIFFHPRNVLFPKNLLIINLPNNQKISESWESWTEIKTISKFFQIILIAHQDFELILQSCEILDIKISGLYLLPNLSQYSKELSKLQDYSQVFQDFKCKYLQKNVLIITYHLLVEDEDIEKFLLRSYGTSPKIAALRVPVPLLEYSDVPYTFLLQYPTQEVNFLGTLLSKLVQGYNSVFDYQKIFRNEPFLIVELNFFNFLQYHCPQQLQCNAGDLSIKVVIFKPNV